MPAAVSVADIPWCGASEPCDAGTDKSVCSRVSLRSPHSRSAFPPRRKLYRLIFYFLVDALNSCY